MTIHREGKKILIILLLILIGLNSLVIAFSFEYKLPALLFFGGSAVLYFFVLHFFRNPNVQVALNEKYILAPADGKVVVIEEVFEDEHLKEDRRQISIFMSPLNVHVNRNPLSGRISYFKYHPGKYLVAWHPKSSKENERTTIALQSATGPELVIRQIAGAMARRIRCYVRAGDAVTQGAEFGFIKFGSRVDVFIPLNAQIKVKLGSKTQAGKTVIAELL